MVAADIDPTKAETSEWAGAFEVTPLTDAWALVIGEMRPKLVGYLRSRRNLELDEAEALISDTYLELARSSRFEYRNDITTRSYVFATLKRIEIRHSRQRSQETPIDEIDGIANARAEWEPSDLDPLVIRDLVSRLDEITRVVLHLKFVEELTITEIAGQLGYSDSWVRRMLRDAYRKMASWSNQAYDDRENQPPQT